jgi:PPP family 3-phenylpropionic acid transporter
LVSQIFHAITYGLFHSVMVQVIFRFFQGRFQIRGQALYGSITYGAGGAVGSLVSGYVVADKGAEALFLYSGIMMALVSLFAMLFLKLPKSGESDDKNNKTPTAAF